MVAVYAADRAEVRDLHIHQLWVCCLYRRCDPFVSLEADTELGPGVTVDRILGLLSQTMGKPDQAATHFEDAKAFCSKGGYRPELAWTCCDYADTLRNRDAEGDRTKAVSLLDESLAISGELGMRPLMERVLSRRDILKA